AASSSGEDLLAQVLEWLKAHPLPARAVFHPGSAHPPVIMVPEAISEQLCRDLLAHWRAGKQYQGPIRARAGEKVHGGGKGRVDVDILERALLTRIDAEMCKRVFPEIRKTAGVEITYRERYKIGGYFAQDEGFYNQHRDTGEHLSYRR